MAFSVSVGVSDFAAIRNAGDYYVDKSELIYDLVENTHNAVTLFTRPRRFGKTLTMSMFENFFNIEKNSHDLFEGLNISRHVDFCNKWMNKFPVIFLSFKDVEGIDFDGAYKMLKTKLSELSISMNKTIQKDLISEPDFETYKKLCMKTGSIDDIKNSLKFLMRMLYTIYHQKIILLLDEYDVPLSRASECNNEYYDNMLDVIKGIMSTALKDNEYLQFAVITGCLKIAKESVFTGTNNFASYSVLDDFFSNYFGFSDNEVLEMLKVAEHEDKFNTIKEWYNGYIFGTSCVYGPWDVINYLSDLKEKPNSKPQNYWKNTSHNGILLSFVKRTDFSVSSKFETLVNRGTITARITDQLTYDELHASEDNLWSVLLMTGYVSKATDEDTTDADYVNLKIPNREISSIFEDTVVKLFEETIDNSKQKALINAFWADDDAQVSNLLSDLLWNTISYNDYHEDYYHAFLAGIFVGLGYSVDSNKEHGLGRPDILLLDQKNRRALIIEAKNTKKEEELESLSDTALSQIKEKKYGENLYGYKEVHKYGIAFYQKQALAKH